MQASISGTKAQLDETPSVIEAEEQMDTVCNKPFEDFICDRRIELLLRSHYFQLLSQIDNEPSTSNAVVAEKEDSQDPTLFLTRKPTTNEPGMVTRSSKRKLADDSTNISPKKKVLLDIKVSLQWKNVNI